MEYLCAICEKRVIGWSSGKGKRNIRDYFCQHCFDQFCDDIRSGKEWTVYLRRLENNRRHRERKMERDGIVHIYFDDRYDVDSTGKLIFAG